MSPVLRSSSFFFRRGCGGRRKRKKGVEHPSLAEGRIHEQILMAIWRAGGTVAWTDIFVVHSGSDQSPEGRARKLQRDLRILDLEYKERPDHPFTLFNLGMTYAETGEHEKAIGFLWQSIGRAGEEDSHLRKAYALRVSSYRQLGRQVTAWETCVKGLKQFADDLELRFQQATKQPARTADRSSFEES